MLPDQRIPGEIGMNVETVIYQVGGALCMKTHGHWRDERSRAKALKVAF